jgi:hypothetical protein
MGLGLTEKNGKEASYSLTAGPMYLELGLSTVSTSRAPISIYLLGLLARSSKLIAADFYSPFSFSPLGLGAPGLPGRNTLCGCTRMDVIHYSYIAFTYSKP